MLSWIRKRSKKQVSDSEPPPSETFKATTQNPTFVLTSHSDEQSRPGGEVKTQSTQPLVTKKKTATTDTVTGTNLTVPNVDRNQQRPARKPQRNSSSSLHDERIPDGTGRPRGSSDASAASSYHTCVGDSKSSLVHKHSPTTSRPGTPTNTELRMQSMEERLASLEKKVESIHGTLESVRKGMEKKPPFIESGAQYNSLPKETKGDGIERLSSVEEVCLLYLVTKTV